MIHKLRQSDYHKVKPLFRPLAEHITFCAAMLEGKQAGQIFVNDPAEPRSAFMLTREMWGFLAGEPDNDAFNRALNKAIFTREIVGEGAWGLLLHCRPAGWSAAGLAVVAAPREPVPTTRRRYLGRKMTYDWRANIPEGFTIQQVERALLQQPELAVPDDVQQLIQSWGDTPPETFGFVALHEGKIVAHAVVDCVVNGIGDIGLVTDEAYQRRGLAAVTSAAAVAYGLERGLTAINWDCGATNIGSVRTAEKLGLELERTHTMYIIDFDEAWHAVTLAANRLDAKRYAEGVAICERAIVQKEGTPPHAWYLAARGWAGLGDREKAFGMLHAVADKGWTAVEPLYSREEFAPLREAPEWAAVVAHIRQNQK